MEGDMDSDFEFEVEEEVLLSIQEEIERENLRNQQVEEWSRIIRDDTKLIEKQKEYTMKHILRY